MLSDKEISAYFLIVWDFVNEARRRAIPAMARGSGVGTMVGYCLGLSNACPVQYGLLFERFTDPDRSEYPDIDIDLCQDGRAEILDYVRDKYGYVAQIITFGTMKARAAVRDVGRVLNLPLPDVDRICKLIGDQLGITLQQALDQEPELRAMVKRDPNVKAVMDTARALEGIVRHSGVHAAGVVIATQPLENLVPLAISKQQQKEILVTQWDGPTVEKLGLLKMDFLGLKTLSVLERARQLVLETLDERTIRHATGETASAHAHEVHPLDLDRIDFGDQKVLDLYRRGETVGTFQFESDGMRNLLLKMSPDRLEDLVAANALFRPGPMALIDDYCNRKHGRKSVPQVHEIVDRFTADTYGIMVYQEQVMQIAHELGGIALREAYSLIKAISKKKHDTIKRRPHALHLRRSGQGPGQAQGRGALRPDPALRRLRLQQVALGRLLDPRVSDRLPEDLLSDPVHGGGAHLRVRPHRQARDLSRRVQARASTRRPPGHRGAAARHQPLRRALPGGLRAQRAADGELPGTFASASAR